MGASQEPILPLIDRETPLLDKIRGKERGNSVASNMGKIVGELVLENDQEFILDQQQIFEDKFKESLAEEIGVDKDAINTGLVQDIGELVARSEIEDVLSEEAFDELMGQVDEDDGEESESEEIDSEF